MSWYILFLGSFDLILSHCNLFWFKGLCAHITIRQRIGIMVIPRSWIAWWSVWHSLVFGCWSWLELVFSHRNSKLWNIWGPEDWSGWIFRSSLSWGIEMCVRNICWFLGLRFGAMLIEMSHCVFRIFVGSFFGLLQKFMRLETWFNVSFSGWFRFCVRCAKSKMWSLNG